MHAKQIVGSSENHNSIGVELKDGRTASQDLDFTIVHLNCRVFVTQGTAIDAGLVVSLLTKLLVDGGVGERRNRCLKGLSAVLREMVKLVRGVLNAVRKRVLKVIVFVRIEVSSEQVVPIVMRVSHGTITVANVRVEPINFITMRIGGSDTVRVCHYRVRVATIIQVVRPIISGHYYHEVLFIVVPLTKLTVMVRPKKAGTTHNGVVAVHVSNLLT